MAGAHLRTVLVGALIAGVILLRRQQMILGIIQLSLAIILPVAIFDRIHQTPDRSATVTADFAAVRVLTPTPDAGVPILAPSNVPKIKPPIPAPSVPALQRPAEAMVAPQPSVPSTTEQAEAAAIRLYPALGVQGSPLNMKFHEEYQRLKNENSAFFQNPSWPSILAQQALDRLSTGREETAGNTQQASPWEARSKSTGDHHGGAFYTMTVTNIRSAKDLLHHNSTYGDAIPTYADGIPSSGAGGSTHDIDFTHQVGIKIDFRTVGPLPVPKEYTAEWFFVAKDVNRRKRWIFDNGETPLSGGGPAIVFSKTLNETRINESQYAYTKEPLDENTDLLTVDEVRTKYKSGDETEGWIVRLKDWGQVIRIDASLWELQDQASRSPDQLDAISKSSKPPVPSSVN